MGGGAFNSA